MRNATNWTALFIAVIFLAQIALDGDVGAFGARRESAPNSPEVAPTRAESESVIPNEPELDEGQHSGILTNPTMGAAIIGAIVSVVLGIIQSTYNRRLLWQKQTELEVKRVQNLLDEFYGPFKTLKKANANLEKLLKLESTPSGPERGQWRTLERLLEGYEFTGNQKALVDMILEVNRQLDDLIQAKCGLITSRELQEQVCLFRAHHRVIKAASEGKLQGEFWRFEDYVYPRRLDNLIDAEAEQLQKRLTCLVNARPGRATNPSGI